MENRVLCEEPLSPPYTTLSSDGSRSLVIAQNVRRLVSHGGPDVWTEIDQNAVPLPRTSWVEAVAILGQL